MPDSKGFLTEEEKAAWYNKDMNSDGTLKLSCPLTKSACKEALCAWWHEINKCCSIVSIVEEDR